MVNSQNHSLIFHARAGWLVLALVGGCGQDVPKPSIERNILDGGLDGGSDAAEPRTVVCTDGAEPGPSPLRRLSRVEYGNTLFQLFGNANHQRLGLDSLVPDGESLGFSNQAGVVNTSPLLASQYLDNAETLSEQHVDTFTDSMGECGTDPAGDECLGEIQEWVREFGKRVYRRPLTDDEVVLHSDIYSAEVDARAGHRDGVKVVLQTLLQSPHFLYRPEFGEQDGQANGGGSVPLTSWEVATRLSYMFWNTMPDVGLMERAERDELQTPAQIEASARRLVQANRSRLAFRNFHEEWLDLDDIISVRNNGKDEALFPRYDDGIVAELHAETLAFFEHAIFEENASLKDLLTADYSMMNSATAAFYGMADGPTVDSFERVDLDSEKYSGFLTQAGLLMAHAKADIASPIHRGLFIRKNLLCQPPPSPPPDVPPPPMVDRTKTTREQFAEHSDNPTCAACHRLMDPIGLAFEHFDAVGLYREDEWGQSIDATGTIFQRNGADFVAESEFDGVVELGQVLADSPRVKECVARQWFRYSMGRGETESDACSLQAIDADFAAAGYDIKELLVAIAKTPAFRARRIVVAGGQP